MKFMEDRILRDGQVRPGNILKVDSFLNHQLDISLLNEVGKAFYERFKDKGVTRILTVEASGIAIACMTANRLHDRELFWHAGDLCQKIQEPQPGR